jgi:predicted solute-binding protein
MAKKNFVSINSLTTMDRRKLKSAIIELNDSMTRISAENDLQKDVLNNVAEEIGLDKKLVKRLAKTYYKSNFNVEVEENKNFEEFYTVLLTTQDQENVGTTTEDSD